MRQHVSIARPYARALFQIAKRSATQSEWREVLVCLDSIISNESFKPLLVDPNLTYKKVS